MSSHHPPHPLGATPRGRMYAPQSPSPSSPPGATPRGNERVFHHYAAALNSVPLYALALGREPSNGWLWRLASCASGGSLTNVRADGSASMGWHAGNDMLTRDDYSADFGVGFYGHWR